MNNDEEVKLNTEEGGLTYDSSADTENTEEVETNPEETSETVQTESGEEQSEQSKTKKKRDKAAEAEAALKNFEGRTVEPPKKKKYGWLGYVLLAAVIALGLWLVFSNILGDMGDMDDEGPQSIGAVIRGTSWQFALVALAVFLGILIFNWLKYVVIMKTTTGKYSLRTALKVQLLGKFYDNVTPFAVGGQPMQIYYLHKKGYSGGTSSAIILIKYFTEMFCLGLVCLLFMACNTSVLNGMKDETVKIIIIVMAWIGLIANLFMPTMIILFAALPKFATKLAALVINIGYKLKIVKDKEKKLNGALKVVNDFRASVKIMSQKPLNFALLILLCLAGNLLMYSLPFWIMKMYKPDIGFEFLVTVTALNIYASQSVAIIPTPGNSGAIEFSSTSAFSILVSGALLSWSVFTWRLCTFYVYLVVGLGFTIFDLIRKIVRNRKQKKESAGQP